MGLLFRNFVVTLILTMYHKSSREFENSEKNIRNRQNFLLCFFLQLDLFCNDCYILCCRGLLQLTKNGVHTYWRPFDIFLILFTNFISKICAGAFNMFLIIVFLLICYKRYFLIISVKVIEPTVNLCRTYLSLYKVLNTSYF